MTSIMGSKRRALVGSALALACALPWSGALAQSAAAPTAQAPGPAKATGAPTASDAWARATVAGQGMGGGYLTFVGSAAADRLIDARAAVSASVELHRMAMEGNTMRMRRVDAIDIPAGKTVKLEPGGLHLMFIGLKAPLTAGTSFPLTLRFEKGGETTLQMQVRAAAASGGAMGSGGAMHKP